tara:strand:- start:2918 stop:3613 length:696 start_codon:yes stop_codon:yes gene_type:complete
MSDTIIRTDFDDSHLYNKYNVSISIRDKVYGGLPKKEGLVKAYVEAKFKSEDTTIVETDLDLKEEHENHITGFKSDQTGVYIGAYALKAACKQYASLMKLTVKKRGVKNTVKEAFFIKGRLNGALTEGKVYYQPLVLKADGEDDFAGHVETLRGKRAILKTAEFMTDKKLEFQLWILNHRMSGQKELTSNDVCDMLMFGQECGIGSCRAFESGKYNLQSFEDLNVKKKKGK